MGGGEVRAKNKLLEPIGGNSFKRSVVKPCLLSGSSLGGSSLGSSAVNNGSSTVNNSSSAVYSLFNNSGGVLGYLSLLSILSVGAGNHANASDYGKSQN